MLVGVSHGRHPRLTEKCFWTQCHATDGFVWGKLAAGDIPVPQRGSGCRITMVALGTEMEDSILRDFGQFTSHDGSIQERASASKPPRSPIRPQHVATLRRTSDAIMTRAPPPVRNHSRT
jgi:hypothetical protein